MPEALVQHLQLLQPIAVGDGRAAVLLVELEVRFLTLPRAVDAFLKRKWVVFGIIWGEEITCK